MVLYDVGDSYVRVADPAAGIRRISRAEFAAKWSGYTALFDCTEAFAQAPEAKSALRRFAPVFRQYRMILLQALILAGIVTFLQLLFPVFTQIVLDRVIVENNADLLHVVLIGMGAVIVFTQIANLLQQYFLSFAAVRIDATLLDFLTRQLLSLPMSYFHTRWTGDSTSPQWRARNSTFCRRAWHRRPLLADHACRRACDDAGLQPGSRRRVPDHDAPLRIAHGLVGQSAAPSFL